MKLLLAACMAGGVISSGGAACAQDDQAEPEAVTSPAAIPVATTHGPCAYSLETHAFIGTPAEQAQCLLRPVKRWAELGEPLDEPPAVLEGVGGPPPVTIAQFRQHLAAIGVDEADLGGSLDHPLSVTAGGLPARYFVIHDTSTPNYKTAPFPADINADSWRWNALEARWGDRKPIAHVFTSRTGESHTQLDFARPWRATKLESKFAGASSRGRFVHVENTQPRRSLESAFAGNDALAPDPGFTEPQYRRLAQIYIAASLRAGEMLIPAYHAVLDSGFENAHDDPQKFDLTAWTGMLEEELAAAGAYET